MVGRRKPSVEGPLPAGDKNARNNAAVADEAIDRFLWNIISISNHYEEISFVWARMLGVNVHQWMILMAVKDMDRGGGVSVKGVSLKLHADSSFITAQSKGLEKLGLLKRTSSPEDARVVLMSLTTKASKDISNLNAMREPFRSAIFKEMSEKEVSNMNKMFDAFREKFERAAKRLAAEL